LNNNPIFCAIDTSNIDTATNLVNQIKPYIGGIKLGLEFFTSCGISGCHSMKEFDLPLFIDLKLHDIPNTVSSALKGIFSLEPKYTTLHISGGSEMLKTSVNLKNELKSKTNLLGVTILTSFDDSTIDELGFGSSVKHSIEQLTSIAHECGLDGIVCSPQEVSKIKENYKNKLKLIVPGIRSGNNDSDDQKRTLSAKEAINAGADILVVGRPITKAKDPVKAAENLLQEIM
tara:strand:+ start:4127 stop:4819 length:693 start_codon:yes stop_codon:yes gene_type:complete